MEKNGERLLDRFSSVENFRKIVKMTQRDGKECQMCKQQVFKYKCPKCSFKSCSLKCSKEHVSQELCRPVEQPVVEKKPEVAPVVEFEDEHVVPASKLEQLRASKKLKDVMRNPHLREILRNLDSSKQPWKDLGNIMLEPIFAEFADACLEVIEPHEEMMK